VDEYLHSVFKRKERARVTLAENPCRGCVEVEVPFVALVGQSLTGDEEAAANGGR